MADVALEILPVSSLVAAVIDSAMSLGVLLLGLLLFTHTLHWTLVLLPLVYLPLMTPSMVAIGIYSLLLAWNEYLYAFVMISSASQMTVSMNPGTVNDTIYAIGGSTETYRIVPTGEVTARDTSSTYDAGGGTGTCFAAAGGGGRGMRRVVAAEDLVGALLAGSREVGPRKIGDCHRRAS